VEFQRYWRYDPRRPPERRWQSPHYLALVLRPDGDLQAVPLGEAAPIEAAVSRALRATAANLVDAPELWAEVSRLLLSPLQTPLAGVRELFLSPDGELNRVPFAALPDPARPGQLLAETLHLRLLTTGRDLLRLQQPPRRGGPSVLIANPLYDDGPTATTASTAAPSAATTAATTAGRRGVTPAPRQLRAAAPVAAREWPALPATAEEARRLAPLLGVRQPITGSRATAALVLRQRAPLVLHIAAHGFFDPEPALRWLQAPRQPGDSEGTAPIGLPEDPLLRSGLALAGANHPDRNPADDGYLTAAEVVGMDLEGTELVTLSACETGLGDVRSGEGVYGLQRALTVAGARSTLLSLWKVDDGATAAFMAEFYGRLRRGEGRGEALAHSQSAFRRHVNPLYRDLAVWGAFQLSGDWRPLAALH
jgi:CHAT domain-containing protein